MIRQLMFGAGGVLMLVAAAAAQPGGTLVVLNKGEATASIIDMAARKEVSRLSVGAGPHEAAASPDGRLIVVANYGREMGGSTLSVIELAGEREASEARVVRTIALTLDGTTLRRPHGLAFIDARHVAVTVEANRAVAIVDAIDGRVLHAIGTEADVSHMVAVSADRAYTANLGSGSMTVIDLKSRTVLAQVPTGQGAEGVDVAPDGKHIWVSNRDSDTVSVIDAASLKVIDTLEAPGFPIRARFSSDGKRVLVTAPRADRLHVFDAHTRKLERTLALPRAPTSGEGRLFGSLAPGSTVPIGVVTDATGRYAMVAQATADQVAVFDLERGEVVATIRTGNEPDGMAWSPATRDGGR